MDHFLTCFQLHTQVCHYRKEEKGQAAVFQLLQVPGAEMYINFGDLENSYITVSLAAVAGGVSH